MPCSASEPRQRTTVKAAARLWPQRGHHEINEGANLRCRQVTRRIQRIEREPLVGPIRKQIDELAVVEQFLYPQGFDLRHADTGETRGEDRAAVGQEESPQGRHRAQFSAAVDL